MNFYTPHALYSEVSGSRIVKMIEDSGGLWAKRDDVEQVEKERDAYKKMAQRMEECVDNVREAMGLESTHFLILHDDVRDMRLKGEQAAKGAVALAELVCDRTTVTNEMVRLACTIIERYEGGKG